MWRLCSVARGEVEVPSGSPVSLEVRRGVTRGEVEVHSGSPVSQEVR